MNPRVALVALLGPVLLSCGSGTRDTSAVAVPPVRACYDCWVELRNVAQEAVLGFRLTCDEAGPSEMPRNSRCEPLFLLSSHYTDHWHPEYRVEAGQTVRIGVERLPRRFVYASKSRSRLDGGCTIIGKPSMDWNGAAVQEVECRR